MVNPNKPVFTVFPDANISIQHGECPICHNEINDDEFKDDVSREEYQISGLCQKCQDDVFKEE